MSELDDVRNALNTARDNMSMAAQASAEALQTFAERAEVFTGLGLTGVVAMLNSGHQSMEAAVAKLGVAQACGDAAANGLASVTGTTVLSEILAAVTGAVSQIAASITRIQTAAAEADSAANAAGVSEVKRPMNACTTATTAIDQAHQAAESAHTAADQYRQNIETIKGRAAGGATNAMAPHNCYSGTPPGANVGRLEGRTDVQVDNLQDASDTITDIDSVENGRLWEHKSATSAGNVGKWIDKHITKKFNSYKRARQHLDGYEDAPIGFRFTTPGADPQFKVAVEQRVTELRAEHPDVDISIEWAQ